MGVLDLLQLGGQATMITGVGRGIGPVEAGDVGLYRTHCEDANQAVSARGRRVLPVHCDMETATVADPERGGNNVVDTWGRLDILVNNAGVIRRSPALDYQGSSWDAVLQVNLSALLCGIQTRIRRDNADPGQRAAHSPHQRERDRARPHHSRQRRPPARESATESGHPGTHPRRPVGHA